MSLLKTSHRRLYHLPDSPDLSIFSKSFIAHHVRFHRPSTAEFSKQYDSLEEIKVNSGQFNGHPQATILDLRDCIAITLKVNYPIRNSGVPICELNSGFSV
jgi:hypothetical protein